VKHIASVALVVGLDALLGCRGQVLLGSEPEPDATPPSSNPVTMSSEDASSAPTSTPTSNEDASSAPTSTPTSNEDASSAPTWTQIWTNYLQAGTVGNCNTACHIQMGTPSSAYAYLQSQGYINGVYSILGKTGSCLSWYAGNMPPGGPRNVAMAVADINAWVAAGAMDN
jgi:hypothetical protein